MGTGLVLTVTRETKVLVNFVFCLRNHSGLCGYYFMLLSRNKTSFSLTVEAIEVFSSSMGKKLECFHHFVNSKS